LPFLLSSTFLPFFVYLMHSSPPLLSRCLPRTELGLYLSPYRLDCVFCLAVCRVTFLTLDYLQMPERRKNKKKKKKIRKSVENIRCVEWCLSCLELLFAFCCHALLARMLLLFGNAGLVGVGVEFKCECCEMVSANEPWPHSRLWR